MVLAIHQHELAMCPPILKPPPTFSSPYPSALSQSTSFGCPVSCRELALVIYFTYGNAHVSMLFSQIILPSPSPTESRSLFFTSVSPLLPCTQNRQNRILSVHDNIGCLFFFLPDFTLYNRLQVHPPLH